MTTVSPTLERVRRVRLRLEFAGLFVVLPLLTAFVIPPADVPVVFGLVALGSVGLLAVTEGFRWRTLFDGPILTEWRVLVAFVVLVSAGSAALVQVLNPAALLAMPQRMPDLWLRIMIFYPLLSALPQELLYRVLFFERYGALFADPRQGLAANAACFALAHLFYLNWVAVALTFPGGLIFAWAYASKRSFGLAFLLHMLAGQILFTAGLGIYFYHGAIGSL